MGNRRCELLLVHCPVAYHDNFVQDVDVLPQGDVHFT